MVSLTDDINDKIMDINYGIKNIKNNLNVHFTKVKISKNSFTFINCKNSDRLGDYDLEVFKI